MAKTNEFELFAEISVSATAANTPLDMTDYVDIADNQAFEVHEIDIVYDVTQGFPGTNSDAVFQLADSNIANFVTHADRTSLYVQRQTFDSTTLGMYRQESFSSLTPLIVSKTLFLRSDLLAGAGGATLDFTLRMKGKIVTPSAKDYMALVLTQTGNVA